MTLGLSRGRRFGLLLLACTLLAARSDAPVQSVRLEVLLVNDPDFPEVAASDAKTILERARDTLADKLGFTELEFVPVGAVGIREFMARNVPAGDACIARFEPHRVRPGKRTASGADAELVRQFLSRWEIDSLRAFFPEERRASLSSYDAIREALLTEFDRKVEKVAAFRLENGESLLAPKTLEQRSYVNWICAVRNQNEADLILTNAFILYDLATEPYPHSIFQKCKVGGASLLSPERRAIRRRAVVASTFSMVTDLPFFQEEGVETLSADEKLAVIGTFIVAHELGHAVFKIPDFYDHPPQCLMTTKFETGYVSGYRELQAHPGACPKCQPYVDAKRYIFHADAAREADNPAGIIENLMRAIAKTPRHVDGNRTRYLVELSVDLAEAYAAQGETKMARRWLRSALLRVPDHERALSLEASMAPEKKDNPPENKEKTKGAR